MGKRSDGLSKEKQGQPAHLGDLPPCAVCKHLAKMGDQGGKGWTCKAYPAGIPATILDRTEDHTKPLPFDNGFQYQVDAYQADNGKWYVPDWWGVPHEVAK